MSVDKFKRILKVLISEHIFSNTDHFFLHNVNLRLCSKKEFEVNFRKTITDEMVSGYLLAPNLFKHETEMHNYIK